VFDHLQIYEPRERRLVGIADTLLRGAATLARLRPRAAAPDPPRRILILRLERLGDLLMTLPALAALRARAPEAEVDLVVGTWNAPIARLVPGVDRCETLDAPWLAREVPGASVTHLLARALVWRRRRYDLALNFEPDIRSNLLLALTGARRRVGFASRGGGPCLTDPLAYDPQAHTAANTRRLVDAALPPADGAAAAGGSTALEAPRLELPAAARLRARRSLAMPRGDGPLVGLHPSGGRAVKQWDPRQFGRVAAHLAAEHRATIVLTGSASDRALVDSARATIAPAVPVIDLCGRLDIVELAAVLEQLDLFVTGDTGPMHLAAAVGTPVVAIFGPSDPARWGPLGSPVRVVRARLWCSPCNRIRRPPARCTGRVPDCLVAVEVDQVTRAARDLLARRRGSDASSELDR
jgi:lipopolysaccharide heptosyltransferase II